VYTHLFVAAFIIRPFYSMYLENKKQGPAIADISCDMRNCTCAVALAQLNVLQFTSEYHSCNFVA